MRESFVVRPHNGALQGTGPPVKLCVVCDAGDVWGSPHKSGSSLALRPACAPLLQVLVRRRPPPRPSLRSPYATRDRSSPFPVVSPARCGTLTSSSHHEFSSPAAWRRSASASPRRPILPQGKSRPSPTGWRRKNPPTCSSTRTIPWTGIRGATRPLRRPERRTSPFCSPSVTPPATGATRWNASRFRTKRSPPC